MRFIGDWITVYGNRRSEGLSEALDVLSQVVMRKSRKMRVGESIARFLEHLVEQCFNTIKSVGRVATRYNKPAKSFLGFIGIAAIRLWLPPFVNMT
ncbi:transposase [Sagittula marina]|uniref:Transposase n=2 Tax=Sagittula marina TaxID=943940 RepID=A0A7W6DW43_9RHOB|nr:transposase [Sagittula marina]